MGGRGVGIPKLRWLNNAEADMDTAYKRMETKSSRQKRMDDNSKGG
jgi:hypothetical protein